MSHTPCVAPLQNADGTNAMYCLGYVLSSLMMWNISKTLNEGFRRQLVRLAESTSVIVTERHREHMQTETVTSSAAQTLSGVGRTTQLISNMPQDLASQLTDCGCLMPASSCYISALHLPISMT